MFYVVRYHWQLQILFMANVSELKTKGLKAASWNFFNMMINQLRNFIVTLVLARLLTPADFGLVSMAMVLNSILDLWWVQVAHCWYFVVLQDLLGFMKCRH